MDTIVQQIKRDLDLVHYALQNGFEIDKQKSSKRCKVLRGSIRKIGISQKDGQWCWYSFDDKKGGSVIDFYMELNRVSFPDAVRALEGMLGIEQPILDPVYKVTESAFDRDLVRRDLDEHRTIVGQHWFLSYRGITNKTIQNERFMKCLFTDKYNNAVFPHYDRDGYTGSEKKNKTFAGFSEFGCKALWFSRSKPGDTNLAFSESGLDCLSRFQIKDDGLTQYFSVGGNLSPDQFDLIEAVFKKNPGKNRILSFDNDKAGRDYVEMFKTRFPEEVFEIDYPGQEGDDWNDLVKKKE